MKKIFCFILAILSLICIVPFLTGIIIHKMVVFYLFVVSVHIRNYGLYK